MKLHKPSRWLAGAAALCAAGLTAFGGSASYNFDTDPISGGVLVLYGNGIWEPLGGNPAAGGWLQLAGPVGGQKTAIVFDDFDNGLVVKAFNFKMDLRIGNGTANPADGFSVNYLRDTDPVLTGGDPLNGYASVPPTPPSVVGEANLPEEGSTTGLGIGFDAWYSGGDGTGGLGDDVIGLSVRLDNRLIAQYSLPTKNGACTDITSLQTGPWDGTSSTNGLCWAPFEVNLAENGKLIIKWKNHEYTPAGGLQVNFVPSRGRLVLAGRTGGSYMNIDIDNVSITTVAATTPIVSPVTGTPTGFSLNLIDAGTVPPTTVNTASVKVSLNGTTITPTVNKVADTTTVTYNQFPTLFVAGSTNTVGIGFLDSNGTSNSATRVFVVGNYTVVPASLATAAGQVDTTVAGFKIRSYQTAAGHGNVIANVENELAGLAGPNLADLATNWTVGADGYFTNSFPLVYFNITPGAGANSTNYLTTQEPGFPGGGPNTYDNAAMEILSYVKFPAAGFYTMGVDSDDGFKVTVAKSVADKAGLLLGQFDGGRGIGGGGTRFTFVINQAGTYPVRLVWFNGGGGSGVEWYSVNADGTKSLVNDAADPKALVAYRNSSVPAPVPYLDLASPFNKATGVAPTTAIKAAIVDGNTLTVNQASIALSLNGSAVTPTISKAGNRTSLTYQPAAILASGSTNTVTLVYADSGTAKYTNSWWFVAGTYNTLSTDLWSPLGSGDSTKPGFRLKTWQIDVAGAGVTNGVQGNNRNQNLVAFAEQELQGLFGPNVANLANFTGGYYTEPFTINYDIAAAKQGNFGGEVLVPGIPGTPIYSNPTENFSVEIQTYIEFPTAGLYTFGFNSDDGFRTTEAEAASSIYALKVNAPTAIAGALGAVSAGTDEGGLALPLPKTPITAQVVYADPPLATNALNNAAAAAGKIVLIDRGVNGFTEKLQFAINAGAAGVIVVNNRVAGDADGILPFVMGGGQPSNNIPAVMVSSVDGQKIKAHLADAGGVSVSLGADPVTSLGDFNGGRGASDTIYNVVVPQAGVYPLRTVWFQGGGGGNAEWFSVKADGTKILLGDNFTTGYMKAFAARTAVNRPIIGIAGSKITYTGTLQSSATVNGTYTDVTGATSPYTVTAPAFFRTRN